MAKIKVRKGMPSVQLDKQEFKKRFLARFYDPEFEALKRELDKIAETAWVAYDDYHKSPRTRKGWRVRPRVRPVGAERSFPFLTGVCEPGGWPGSSRRSRGRSGGRSASNR